ERGLTNRRGGDTLDERDPKRECLARARGRRHEDVEAAEGVGHDELLHRERRRDAAALERAYQMCAHAERGKRLLHVFTPCPSRVEIERLETPGKEEREADLTAPAATAPPR